MLYTTVAKKVVFWTCHASVLLGPARPRCGNFEVQLSDTGTIRKQRQTADVDQIRVLFISIEAIQKYIQEDFKPRYSSP